MEIESFYAKLTAYLSKQGFYEIDAKDATFELCRGGDGIRLVCAHTDSPGFKIKPIAESCTKGYIKLGVQAYAWPILSTWFDRPLSMAGRVAIRGKSAFNPEIKLVKIIDAV